MLDPMIDTARALGLLISLDFQALWRRLKITFFRELFPIRTEDYTPKKKKNR